MSETNMYIKVERVERGFYTYHFKNGPRESIGIANTPEEVVDALDRMAKKK